LLTYFYSYLVDPADLLSYVQLFKSLEYSIEFKIIIISLHLNFRTITLSQV